MTPDFTPQEASLDLAAAERLLGIPLGAAQARDLLRRMGHAVGRPARWRGRNPATAVLRVQVPAWRNDILHERDLVEDLAIAHGYGNFPGVSPRPRRSGSRGTRSGARTGSATCLPGSGFTEIVGLFLTCHEQSDGVLGLPPHPATVLLENPISVEQTQLRTSLLPGILHTFARNRSNPLPQADLRGGGRDFRRRRC